MWDWVIVQYGSCRIQGVTCNRNGFGICAYSRVSVVVTFWTHFSILGQHPNPSQNTMNCAQIMSPNCNHSLSWVPLIRWVHTKENHENIIRVPLSWTIRWPWHLQISRVPPHFAMQQTTCVSVTGIVSDSDMAANRNYYLFQVFDFFNGIFFLYGG